MKRYFVLIACIVMQMCLGPIYAWSTFVPKLQAGFGYESWQTQLVFGTSFLVFSVAGVFAGRILDRYGPRVLSVIAGLLLGSGYLLASFCGDCFLAALAGHRLPGRPGHCLRLLLPRRDRRKVVPRA